MSGLASQGTLIQYDTTGSGNWVAIASVKDADGANTTIGEKDVTPLNPAGRAKAKIPTILDGGKFKLTLLFDKNDFATVFTTLQFQTKNWRVNFSEGSLWTFSGFWTTFGIKTGGAEDDVEADVEFSITGAPTWTP